MSLFNYKGKSPLGFQEVVVGRINGVVGLTGFSDKKMTGRLVGTKKSGHNNELVVLTRWS